MGGRVCRGPADKLPPKPTPEPHCLGSLTPASSQESNRQRKSRRLQLLILKYSSKSHLSLISTHRHSLTVPNVSFPKYTLLGGCSNQPGVKFQATSSEPLEFISKGDKLPQLTGLSFVTSKSWRMQLTWGKKFGVQRLLEGGCVYVF